MLNKNEIIDLIITDINSEGAGVGRHDGIAIFVPFSAIGDRLRCRVEKVSKSFCHARIIEVLEPSPDRIEPDCPTFYRCGGCAFRHLDYSAELTAKLGVVTSALRRIGGMDIAPRTILPSPEVDRYRNKAQFVVRKVDGITKTGFFAPRSHRFVPMEDCLLQPKIFHEIAKLCCKFFDDANISCYDEQSTKGIVRHLLLRQSSTSDEVMVCVVNTASQDLKPLAEILEKEITSEITLIENINSRKTNVILGDKNKVICGKGYLSQRLFDDTEYEVEYDIAPHSFFQVNTLGAQNLYNVVREFATIAQDDRVLDLYCGVGSIGLSICSKQHHLVGVDIVPSAIESARQSAKRSLFENSEFICGDAHTGLLNDRTFDVVIIDPPRKGLDELTIELLLKSAPEKIVMVSCNPSTAARDISVLRESYTVKDIVAVDMFARCAHVECVCLLERIS